MLSRSEIKEEIRKIFLEQVRGDFTGKIIKTTSDTNDDNKLVAPDQKPVPNPNDNLNTDSEDDSENELDIDNSEEEDPEIEDFNIIKNIYDLKIKTVLAVSGFPWDKQPKDFDNKTNNPYYYTFTQKYSSDYTKLSNLMLGGKGSESRQTILSRAEQEGRSLLNLAKRNQAKLFKIVLKNAVAQWNSGAQGTAYPGTPKRPTQNFTSWIDFYCSSYIPTFYWNKYLPEDVYPDRTAAISFVRAPINTPEKSPGYFKIFPGGAGSAGKKLLNFGIACDNFNFIRLTGRNTQSNKGLIKQSLNKVRKPSDPAIKYDATIGFMKKHFNMLNNFNKEIDINILDKRDSGFDLKIDKETLEKEIKDCKAIVLTFLKFLKNTILALEKLKGFDRKEKDFINLVYWGTLVSDVHYRMHWDN